MTWTPKQKEAHRAKGDEYDALVLAVQQAEPTVEDADGALSLRLLADLKTTADWIYFKMVDALPEFARYDYRPSVDDTASEYAMWFVDKVHSGNFKTGRSILGHWRYVKLEIRKRVRDEINDRKVTIRYKDHEAAVSADEKAGTCEPHAHLSLLPVERLGKLSTKRLDVLAALEAHDYDRVATAGYFQMKVAAFERYLQRICEAVRMQEMPAR